MEIEDKWQKMVDRILKNGDNRPSDDDLAEYPPFHDAAARERIEQMATELGITPPPRIIEMDLVFEEGTAGEAQQSVEGTKYVLLDKSLTGTKAIAIAAHELGHIKYKDVSAENKENFATDPVSHERRADATAIELCEGRPLAAYFATFPDDPKDKNHPPISDRIKTLLEGAEFMEVSGACPVTLVEQQEAGAPTVGAKPQTPSAALDKR